MSPHIMKSIVSVETRLDRDDRLAFIPSHAYENESGFEKLHDHPEVSYFLNKDRRAKQLKKAAIKAERAQRRRQLLSSLANHAERWLEKTAARMASFFF